MNCIRNYPWYKGWEKTFADEDFTMIGVHTPETAREHDPDRVREKVRDEGFRFPIVLDHEKKNWDAWGNAMWPAVYVLDKRGRVRYWWFGELNWNEAGGQKIMEDKIKELLAEEG